VQVAIRQEKPVIFFRVSICYIVEGGVPMTKCKTSKPSLSEREVLPIQEKPEVEFLCGDGKWRKL
jgi:hypothetical protein